MTRSNRAELALGIEAMGVRATEQHWALIPPDLAKRLRARVARVGDALLTLAASSDSLRMNRVIGLGSRGLAREAMIDEIIAFYRAEKLRRFSVELSHGPQSGRITGWLLARGFTRRGGHGALIASRLRRAARRGSRWIWVETAAPAPGRPSGSRRNLLRVGFEEVCVKPSFIWSGR